MSYYIKFFCIIALLLSGNAIALEVNEEENNSFPISERHSKFFEEPLFNAKENKRNKNLVKADIGLIYQNSGFNMSIINKTLNRQSSLGVNGSLILNITGQAWARIYGEGVWQVGKISGYRSSGINFSPNNFNNSNYEIQAVFGYDIASIGSVDISLYGGLFQKGIFYNGSFSATNITSPLSLAENVSTNYTGGVIGSSLTIYHSDKIVSNIYAEGYLTTTFGDYGTKYSGVVVNTSNGQYNSKLSGGFGIGYSLEAEISKGIFIKPHVKYQMLFCDKVKTNSELSYKDLNFYALTAGLGIGWK